MGNRTAIVVALILCALIGYDLIEQDGTYVIFLARKGADLVEWLAFWR